MLVCLKRIYGFSNCYNLYTILCYIVEIISYINWNKLNSSFTTITDTSNRTTHSLTLSFLLLIYRFSVRLIFIIIISFYLNKNLKVSHFTINYINSILLSYRMKEMKEREREDNNGET